jgi:hypothetical protein
MKIMNWVHVLHIREVNARFEPSGVQKTCFNKIGEVTAHQIIISDDVTLPYSVVRRTCVPWYIRFPRVACTTRSS